MILPSSRNFGLLSRPDYHPAPPMTRRNPATPLSTNKHLLQWVTRWPSCASPTRSTGSTARRRNTTTLCAQMVAAGTFIKLEPEALAGLLLRPLRRERRGPRRGPHLHLLALQGGGRADQQLGQPLRDAAQAEGAVQRLHARPHDVRAAVQHGPGRLAHVADRRAADRLALRRGQHADHGAHRRAPSSPRSTRTRSASCPACTRSACRWRRARRTCRGRATRRSTSSISPRPARSGASARATAATRCWARNASPCASPRTWRATRAGWPSTC